jgi:DNA-binding NarL/FixJ family response regulator
MGSATMGECRSSEETTGIPVWPNERVRYERMVVAARKQLRERAFTSAWVQGRNMTPEKVLAAPGSVMQSSTFHNVKQISPSPITATITYPDDLTAREVEVLRLVAHGLTNEQVAEQLVISPRTVNSHLTSIYSKIRASSRSAATRYAIEHNLV